MNINKEDYITRELCAVAILTLIRKIGKYPTIRLNHIGLDNELAMQLGALNARAQHYITERAKDFIKFSVDSLSLQKVLQKVYDDMEYFEMEDRFLLNGATSIMMHELFGLNNSEFSARRRRIGMGGKESHRPKYCDEKTEHQLWELWIKNKGLSVRERYLKVAELSGQKLSIVRQAVRKYEDEGVR